MSERILADQVSRHFNQARAGLDRLQGIDPGRDSAKYGQILLSIEEELAEMFCNILPAKEEACST